MRSPLWMSSATVWSASEGGAFARSVVSGAHVEIAEEDAPGATGPEKRSVLRLWARGAMPCATGDWIAAGSVQGDRPPASAFRVAHVAPYEVGGRVHHWEAVAR